MSSAPDAAHRSAWLVEGAQADLLIDLLETKRSTEDSKPQTTATITPTIDLTVGPEVIPAHVQILIAEGMQAEGKLKRQGEVTPVADEECLGCKGMTFPQTLEKLPPTPPPKGCPTGPYTHEESREVLIRFLTVMEKHKISIFATEGTLLGAVRNETWFLPLISHSKGTEDFDFGIIWSEFQRAFIHNTTSKPVLQDLYKVGFTSRPRQEHDSDYYLYHPPGLCGFDVELWPWYPCGDTYAYYEDNPEDTPTANRSLVAAKHEAWLFENLSTMTVQGITMHVPKDPHRFLTNVYGDYMIPKQTPGYHTTFNEKESNCSGVIDQVLLMPGTSGPVEVPLVSIDANAAAAPSTRLDALEAVTAATAADVAAVSDRIGAVAARLTRL